MIDNPIYVTPEKHRQMQDELHYLKSVKRLEIAAKIEKAKDLGDLSENAEYAEAKDEYSFTEGRIIELADALHRVVLIEGGGTDVIGIGSKLKVSVNGKEREYAVVGKTEADPTKGLISNESPIGLALIGKKAGDEAVVNAPAGPITYKILSVS